MPTRKLFATRLYETNVGDQISLTDVAHAMRAVAANDELGREWSERFGYRGYCGCATSNDVHLSSGILKDLAHLLEQEAQIFAKECGFDLNRAPQLERMWVNLLRCDGHHRSHIHAHSIISGTLFVEAPEGAGATCFEDPRLGLMMAAPPRANGAAEDLHTIVAIEPRAGRILMWESWLRHEVLAGSSQAERLSITFDFV